MKRGKDSKGKPIVRPTNGRPAPFNHDLYPTLAYEVCSQFGAKMSELAKCLGVSQHTINAWYQKIPSFRAAVKAGRDVFDTENVEASLKKRALGYYYKEVTVKKVLLSGKNEDGITVQVPAVEITKSMKHLAPEVKACMFWLQNRQPDRWKNTSTFALELREKQSIKLQEKQLDELTTDELKLLEKIGTRAIELHESESYSEFGDSSETIGIPEPEKIH